MAEATVDEVKKETLRKVEEKYSKAKTLLKEEKEKLTKELEVELRKQKKKVLSET